METDRLDEMSINVILEAMPGEYEDKRMSIMSMNIPSVYKDMLLEKLRQLYINPIFGRQDAVSY